MQATATHDLTTRTEAIGHLVQDALQRPSVATFEALEQQVGRFETTLREMHQSMLANEARAALANLRSGKPLSDSDKTVLRTLVVGDAESYLHMENNLHDWLDELKRLAGEMCRLTDCTSDRALLHLRGVVRDAVRLLPSIRAYMDEKCRLDRFDRALSSLDSSNRELLVKVVREMLESPQR